MNTMIHVIVFLDILLNQRFREKNFHNITVKPTSETCTF